MYQLDSIIHMERFPGINRTEKKEYKYLENDSLKEIIYYYLDTVGNKFLPNSSYRFYDINPSLYYYSVYYWDIAQNRFKFIDSFKETKTIYSAITYDSSFKYSNDSWVLYSTTISWHNPDYYLTHKRYDSVKNYSTNSNDYLYFIWWKYDEYGRDTLYWQKKAQINLDIIYKKVYDDSSRLSELHYAHYLNKYYLIEKLNYDSNGNLRKIVFTQVPSTGPVKVDSYTYYQYHQQIKLNECNFRYHNEYYSQPFIFVPIEEHLPWASGITMKKENFSIPKPKPIHNCIILISRSLKYIPIRVKGVCAIQAWNQ